MLLKQIIRRVNIKSADLAKMKSLGDIVASGCEHDQSAGMQSAGEHVQ